MKGKSDISSSGSSSGSLYAHANDGSESSQSNPAPFRLFSHKRSKGSTTESKLHATKIKDIETKDIETKDIDTKDIETKDIETKDIETKDIETRKTPCCSIF